MEETWINKASAARIMGRTMRTFEKIAYAAIADGRLQKKMLPAGKGRNYSEAMYPQSEVENLRDTRVLPGKQSASQSAGNTALAVASPVVTSNIDATKNLAELLASMTARLEQPQIAAPVPPPAPPSYGYLSLREAAELIRMTPTWVRAQILNGRLPAEPIGRTFKVRPCDLAALPARDQRANTEEKYAQRINAHAA